MKHLFIINPVAGKGHAKRLIPEICRMFSGKRDEHFVEITQRPGHATEIARKYAGYADMRVYSVGGDGTLNEVLNGLAGSSSSLAIIPAGSGNDFARSLNENCDAFEALHRIVEGKEKLVDLARVNNKYFINISSIGFDAEVVHHTEHFKRLPLVTGKMAYLMGIFSTLVKYNNNRIKINIDGSGIEKDVLLVAVANGRYYGGGMLAAPDAIIDDGEFDVCLIDRMKRPKILHFFPEFMAGRHGKIDGVKFYKGKRIEISSEKPVLLNTDGEIESVTKAVFEIIPKSIRVVVP